MSMFHWSVHLHCLSDERHDGLVADFGVDARVTSTSAPGAEGNDAHGVVAIVYIAH